MVLWLSESPNIYLNTFILLWKLFNYFKTYTFPVNMSHLNCQRITLNTLIFAAFFSVYITCLLSEWEYMCASHCLLLCLTSLYIKLVEHCNDLRINCSKLILTYFSFGLVQFLCEQVNRTSTKCVWLIDLNLRTDYLVDLEGYNLIRNCTRKHESFWEKELILLN